VLRREADILIEIEGGRPAEIELLLAMAADEFRVEPQRSATSGQTEHAGWFRADLGGHDGCAQERNFFHAGANEHFHLSSVPETGKDASLRRKRRGNTGR